MTSTTSTSPGAPDGYAWLRDLERGERLQEWLREHRDRYDRLRSAWEPLRRSLYSEAAGLLPPVAETPRWTVAGRVFWWRWDEGADYPRLWSTCDGQVRVVLDVGALTDTGFVRLGDLAVSPDARRIAYTVDVVGNEVYQLRVADLDDDSATVEVLSDRSYYGLVWSADSTRVMHVVHDFADRPFQVWWHSLVDGTRRLVLEERDERFHVGIRGSGDGRWVVLRAASRLTSEEWLVQRDGGEVPIRTRGRTEGTDYTVEPLDLAGAPMLAVSRQTSPTKYVVVLEGRESGGGTSTLLESAPSRRPLGLTARSSHLLVEGREDGQAVVWAVHLASGAVMARRQASPGTSLRLAPYDDVPTEQVVLEHVAWVRPTYWEAFDPATGTVSRLAVAGSEPVVPTDDLVIETRTVPARDGALIPVTLLRHVGTPLDGTAPCLLYGYGAWETVIDPDHDPVRLALVRSGVVYAHAHIRGGGELGRAWWLQGRMDRKSTTFEDFVDVATSLGEGMVDPDRMVAQGLSAGGLLMGAVVGMAPQLFAGVLAEAPFVDPVTTMSDPTQPLVIVERDEWGDPRRDADRAWMLGWAPFQNVPASDERPRLLVTSALHDPRVSVWEPARWVARLEEDSEPDAVLFRVDLGCRGHWAPPGRWQAVAYRSELLAWVAHTLQLRSAERDGPEASEGGGV